VKKRWHAIYDRVADVDSELLPPPVADGVYSSSRGAERRRHLLNYLRQHPEELRPFERPTQGRANGRAVLPAVKIFVAAAAFLEGTLFPVCVNAFL
jgi:hypothetical protein